MEQVNTQSKGNGGVWVAWLGAIIAHVGMRIPWDYYMLIVMIGLALTVAGCSTWVRRKNRHWLFSLWALFAPIGFLGIGLLRDKSNVSNS